MRTEYLKSIFEKALAGIENTGEYNLFFEAPKDQTHGDLSTNIAMQLAKPLRKAPRAIAQEIMDRLDYDRELIKAIEIAGAGFINIRFSDLYYSRELNNILGQGEDFGRSDSGKGKKVNVEYVSVNPTGLLHLGHGRNASIGDTIANFFEWLGYDVTREYYFNNAGNQMNILAKSIYARYMQSLADPAFPFPDDGYHGDYVREIAADMTKVHGDTLTAGTDKDLIACRKFGEEWCFAKIRKTLERMNIRQDFYFNEDSLYNDGKIDDLIKTLKEKDLAYEKEGATWLALTKLGLNDDRVIIKSTGEPTYRLPDIAYHKDKFERGYDIMVDIFGADHIATIPDVLATLKALDFDTNKVKVIIHQFVTLTENGEQVKMSKRTGKNYTLDDLLDEVGTDVVRFFLLMRGISTHLEFDLDLAREQSDKNPVYYLQYAHARISSIFENAKEKGIDLKDNPDLSQLTHPKELELIKTLLRFPEVVKNAGEKQEPQALAEYLRELAAAFHIFYHECRIIGSEETLLQARMHLAKATKTAMRNGLTILGINAPVRM